MSTAGHAEGSRPTDDSGPTEGGGPTGSGEVRPTAEEVGALVARLVASDWPTTEEERRAWFDEHGIVVEPERWREEDGSRSWSGRAPERWGRALAGWHVFDDEFVGVSWFLWHGLTEDVVTELAGELHARFVELMGPPVEEFRREGDDYRFTACWERDGRLVHLYLHGGPVLDGTFVEDPVVQLHVDHAARSRAADAVAAAAQPQDR